jgi:hypothetical protein
VSHDRGRELPTGMIPKPSNNFLSDATSPFSLGAR